MSTIRFGRDREYRFFRREDIRARWDENSATAFLNRFRSDALAMAGFRRQIHAGAAKLSDDEVIKRVARLLVSGELVVVRPQHERVKDELPPTPPEAPPPPEKKEAAPVEVPEDEPTFAPDNHGELQAAVLITAARTGVAFCEECQRLAEEEQQKMAPPPKPVAKTAPPIERRETEQKSGPTFPPNHDGEAQAEVLIAAAKEGIPFCEECARMAAEEEAKTK